MTPPLVVCWGTGLGSTGMLVGMWERGIKPEFMIARAVDSRSHELEEVGEGQPKSGLPWVGGRAI